MAFILKITERSS